MRLVIDVSELTSEEAKKEGEGEEGEEEERGSASLIDELASFLSERLGKEIAISGGELSLDVEGPAERRRIKQLLKKFLYKKRLYDDFRVISIEEGNFRIKSRRFPRLKPSLGLS